MGDDSRFDNPTKAIVVLFDLLGTKEIYKDTGTIKEINTEYDNLLLQVQEKHENLFTIHIKEREIKLEPVIRFFSDTILIIIDEKKIQKVTPPDLINSFSLDSFLFFYCKVIQRIFFNFFSKGFFLRGAISYGELWVGDNLIIGPAIDEAASWYEQADWMGIFLTPCAKFIYRKYYRRFSKSDTEIELTSTDDLKAVIKYTVPLKENISFETYAITWPLLLKNGNINNKPWVSLFTERPIYPKFYSKYKNTIDFYDYVIKHMNDLENIESSYEHKEEK